MLHASDCALYNAPAYPVGPCDCHAELRHRLAEIIHKSWSLEKFDPEHHPEDLTSADAVIDAFPILASKQD